MVAEGECALEIATQEAEAARWSIVESRANCRLRAKAAHARLFDSLLCRVNRKRDDLKSGDKHFLPNQYSDSRSDNKVWMVETSHPIDWYLVYIENVVDKGNSTVGKKTRSKLRYAWRNYVPGDPCPYHRCVPTSATGTPPHRWMCLLQFARHLVEKHLPSRPYLYCISSSGQTVKHGVIATLQLSKAG